MASLVGMPKQITRWLQQFKESMRRYEADATLFGRVLYVAFLGGWVVYGNLFYAGYFFELGVEKLRSFSTADIRWNWFLRLTSDRILHYEMMLALLMYCALRGKVSVSSCMLASLSLVFGGIALDFADSGNRAGDETEFGQATCWFIAMFVLIGGARIATKLVHFVVLFALNLAACFYCGVLTAQLEMRRSGDDATQVEVLQWDARKKAYALFLGERGVLCRTAMADELFRIEFVPRENVKSINFGVYRAQPISRNACLFATGLAARYEGWIRRMVSAHGDTLVGKIPCS